MTSSEGTGRFSRRRPARSPPLPLPEIALAASPVGPVDVFYFVRISVFPTASAHFNYMQVQDQGTYCSRIQVNAKSGLWSFASWPVNCTTSSPLHVAFIPTYTNVGNILHFSLHIINEKLHTLSFPLIHRRCVSFQTSPRILGSATLV